MRTIMEWMERNVDFQAAMDRVVGYVPALFASLLLIIFFWCLLVIIRKVADRALRRTHVSLGIQGLIRKFFKYGILILAVLTIANQLGFNITALVTGVGLIGLAVSLAAQDTVGNIIAGITLAVDRPFEPGDWVRIGDLHAQVTALRLRSTVFTTFDNETMVSPNKVIASERIINYTQTNRIRVRVPLGIAYKEDIDAAREVMLGTLDGDDRILAEPEPSVLVMQLGASSIDVELRFWIIDPWELFPVQWEYLEKCKKALDKAGIEIPFPHMQLFLERSKGLTSLAESIENRP